MAELSKQLVDAMKQSAESKTSAFDSIGTVRRIKDGIAYVHLAGGVDETPVQLTVDAKAGDEVQVRVSGGRAWIVGNATAPPTDNTMAKQAINYSKIANDAAQRATKDALVANEAAQSASASAREAKETTDEINAYAETAGKTVTQILNDGETAGTAAQQALKGLGQVEDVVGTLNWITDHSKVTTDTTPKAGKSYYIKNQDNTFTLVTDVEGKNPAQEGWYELTEAVQNYILSHLALTNEGLWLIKDGNGYKLKLTNYGSYIVAPDGTTVVNQNTADGNIIRALDGTVIAHLGYGDGASVSGSEVKPYYTLGIRRTSSVGNYSMVEGLLNDATGAYSHAEGNLTTASSSMAHSEGFGAKATGAYSHAEGDYTTASGGVSHAEGSRTTASGLYSHAEGNRTEASGWYSHAQNFETIAGYSYQTVIGKHNDNQQNNAFEIGNGTDVNNRSNAFEVDWSGNVNASGDITDGQGNVLSDKADTTDLDDYVLKATPYYELDTTATSGTDKEIYDALVALGWTDCIV